MNENINLCKILKDCPKGTKLYSYNYGGVEFWGISQNVSCPIMIRVETIYGYSHIVFLTKEGFTSNDYPNLICTLVPSKDQQDWSKWKCPKPKFDPETLKAFDRVLVIDSNRYWTPVLFDHLEYSLNYPRMYCFDRMARKVIPYNDDTKHLVGTSGEPSEYYRYWED